MRPDYYIHKNALSPENCQKIIDWGKRTSEEALLGGGKKNFFKRRSKVAWITKGSDFDDILAPVIDDFFAIARDGYKQKINFLEAIQFTSYGIGGFYGWHMDSGLGANNRIISASIELSPPNSYKGGGLKFWSHPQRVPPREQGSMICFPSLMLHKARPVYWGTRYSLVLWGSMDWDRDYQDWLANQPAVNKNGT